MKDIKDYLHLYTGCRISTPYGECKFLYYKYDIDEKRYNPVLVDRGDNYFAFHLREVKLILRPLSDMTEEEFKAMYLKMPGSVEIEYRKLGRFNATPYQVQYLLSKGFDLFGLIDAGLAIDKTTLKEQV